MPALHTGMSPDTQCAPALDATSRPLVAHANGDHRGDENGPLPGCPSCPGPVDLN